MHRVLVILLLALIASISLTGCGGPGGNPSANLNKDKPVTPPQKTISQNKSP